MKIHALRISAVSAITWFDDMSDGIRTRRTRAFRVVRIACLMPGAVRCGWGAGTKKPGVTPGSLFAVGGFCYLRKAGPLMARPLLM